jgi:hypothetical protein
MQLKSDQLSHQSTPSAPDGTNETAATEHHATSKDNDHAASNENVIAQDNHVDSSMSATRVDAAEAARFRLLPSDAKMACLVETGARIFFCTRRKAEFLQQRTILCAPLLPTALREQITHRFYRQQLQHKPDSSVHAMLTTMVYEHSMQACERENYLQLYPRQTRDTPMITVMNSVVDPGTIRNLQRQFNNRDPKDIFAEQDHPARELMLICFFGTRFHDLLKTEWLPRYWIDGYQWQDKLNFTDHATYLEQPRRPIILTVGGGWWCVARGIDEAWMCTDAIHALAVWLSLVSLDHDNMLEDGLRLDRISSLFLGTHDADADRPQYTDTLTRDVNMSAETHANLCDVDGQEISAWIDSWSEIGHAAYA